MCIRDSNTAVHVAEQLKNPAVSCIINKDEVVQSAGIGILNSEFTMSSSAVAGSSVTVVTPVLGLNVPFVFRLIR